MGGAFEEEEIVWRKKGQHISKLSADEIKSIINRKFRILQESLGDDYGRGGYSCTLYETDGANINYFHFLNDRELDKLKNWIFNFDRIILGSYSFTYNYAKEYNAKQKYDFKKVDARYLKYARNWGWYVLDQRFERDRYGNYVKWSTWGSDTPPLNDRQITEYRDEIVKAFNKWQKKLGKRDKEILKKLRENDFYMTKQGYYLYLIADDKGGDAVGLANNNKVWFGSMVSC
jgi:hypothetical protein